MRRAFVFRKTWDLTQIPCPFTRAAIFIAPPIVVPPNANEDEQSRRLGEVQSTLDDLRRRGEAWTGTKNGLSSRAENQ
ncbi:MAG: hypothetical protein LAP13_24205 [Acidobacteriia bacterium]|nr:hypothetical protein [Terriglobia bacterium]